MLSASDMTVAVWAGATGFAGALWTNLACKFSGNARRGIMPTGEAVVAYLRRFAGEETAEAQKCVHSPLLIDTPIRRLMAEQLGLRLDSPVPAALGIKPQNRVDFLFFTLTSGIKTGS